MNAFSALFLCLLLNFSSQDIKAREASDNYLELRRYYLKWSSGPPGSASYFRKILYSHLVEMIGKEIKTDYDYTLWSFDGNTIEAKFACSQWLVLKGEISDRETLKKVQLGKNFEEKTKLLFSISGKIKRFRLSEYEGERKVFLILENIKTETFLFELKN
ncbi:MAG TPA: hypothetical protein PLA51_11805 [Spirochaetota bacterium]|nr:hypothetical protein [Spirochaetota bacterium]